MALKGKFKFFDKLESTEAYAIVDNIQISKGGSANCHVSVYPTPPTTKTVIQDTVVAGVMEKLEVEQIDRGPCIEHFSVAGIQITSSPFSDCYNVVKATERLAAMVDA